MTLPESLTTYRIMAVAGDKQSRFGWDDAEIRINKPLMLTPAWPRFLAVGDKAHFGAVVHNQLEERGKATVTIESLDPSGTHRSLRQVRPSRFRPGWQRRGPLRRRGASRPAMARVRMRVQMGRENDAFEDVIPVRVLVLARDRRRVRRGDAARRRAHRDSRRCRAGIRWPARRAGLDRPGRISPRAPGISSNIRTDAPSSAPRAPSASCWPPTSASAFNLAGIDAAKGKGERAEQSPRADQVPVRRRRLLLLAGRLQRHLAVSHELRPARLPAREDRSAIPSTPVLLDRALPAILEARLSETPPVNEGWRPAYNAWQAFVVKVLAEGGRNADSHLKRVYGYRDRMPVFALAFLIDALQREEGDRRSCASPTCAGA